MPEKTIIRSTDSSGNMNTAMPATIDNTPERMERPRLCTMPVSTRVTTPSIIPVSYTHLKKNIDTIMTLVDKFVPEYVLPSQRRAFDTAIRERNNWYRLMMRIFDLNPCLLYTSSKEEYDATAKKLAGMFQENFEKKYAHLPENVKNAGPRA